MTNKLQYPISKILTCLLLSALGCSAPVTAQTSAAGVTVIDLAKNKNSTGKLLLSDIAEDVEYVRMETKPECLFYTNYKMIVTDKYIIAGAHSRPVLVFDRQGKFLRNIGSVGQGPGEFMRGSDLLFDPVKNILRVFDKSSGKLIAYTIDGKYISETIPGKDTWAVFPLTSERLAWCSPIQQNANNYLYTIWETDWNGKFLKCIPETPLKDRKLNQINFIGWLHPSPEGMLLQYTYQDTIYLYTGNALNARYLLALGDMKMPLKIAADREASYRNENSYISELRVFTEPAFWMLRYMYRDEQHTAYYDLKSGKIFYIKDLDAQNRGLINDIDGGPGALPAVNENEKYWFASLQPVNLLEWNEK
ncbi:MAG: 6-bladed beta-propeller, partial [Bacteroidia bacterium]|nr:6-bladed beta-propeller [Bacteroidia bacterium]